MKTGEMVWCCGGGGGGGGICHDFLTPVSICLAVASVTGSSNELLNLYVSKQRLVGQFLSPQNENMTGTDP